MVAGHLQEKNGYFYMVLNFLDNNGKRKPRWISTGLPVKGNKRKAEAMLNAERQKYNSECETPVKETPFSDYMLYWLSVIKPNVEENTYSGYESNVTRVIVPYFKAKKVSLQKLRPIDIQNFYIYCSNVRHVCNNTILHYHANLSSALRYATEKELISVNPMLRVDRPKLKQHIGQYYNLAEIEELLRCVHGDPVEFPVLMAAFYGLRRSEIVGLRWKAVDFENNIITIEHTVVQAKVDGKMKIIQKDRAKNKSSYRSLPLVPQFRDLLLQMKAHQDECRALCGKSYFKSDYIYVNDIGKPYKPDYISNHYRYLLPKLGLRKITFHELRHSCASLLLKSGVSIKDIQAWLGHSSYNTTANIYAHLDTESRTATGNVMANKLDISVAIEKPRA